MKIETTVRIAGKDERVVVEQGRNFIATHTASQLSGNGSSPEQAIEAMLRNINNPDSRAKGVK